MAVSAACAWAATAALAVYVPTRAEVQRALDALVAGGAPGVTAVIHGPHGVERYSAGSANLHSGAPISPLDSGRIGSTTKMFTATVVLQLVGEGRLSLGDSIEKWLPGLVPGGDRITVRELLDHTSGLTDYCNVAPATMCDAGVPDMARRWTQRQLVAIGAGAPSLFLPGQGWSYTNTGYVLLGMIVERVTGHTLAAEYTRSILQPLGLRHTEFPVTTAMPRPHSNGYDVMAAGSWPLDVTATSPTIAWGAGAMVATIGDLDAFTRALLGGRLVTPSLLHQMEAAAPGSLAGLKGVGVGGTYGLGLIHFTWAYACGVWGHTGDFPGYHTLAASTGDGRRSAAMYITSDALPTAGALARSWPPACWAAGCALGPSVPVDPEPRECRREVEAHARRNARTERGTNTSSRPTSQASVPSAGASP